MCVCVCVCVGGVRGADLSHKKQDVDGKPLTEVTAKDQYTRDTDELFYERLYYVGNEEYCKGVMSTITRSTIRTNK